MKQQFSELDAIQKQLVQRLADEAETLTPIITASAAHIGELWEAQAFFLCYPKGTTQHARLADRLRLGATSSECILDVIQHAAPAYATLGQRCASEQDDQLSESENVFTSL